MNYTTLDKICENLDCLRKPITGAERILGDIPYYGASGIVDYVHEHIFDEKLLLVSEDGANLLARSTPIAFSIEGKAWVNNHAHVLRFKDEILQKCVELYLNSISLEPYITGTAQPKLNQKMLNEIPIPIMDKEIMESIVRIVDRLEEVINRRKQELEELDNLIKSRFVEMFNEKYPEDTLLNLCNIIDYRGKTPEKVESGLPFITAKNVKMHYMTMEPREYISEETYHKVMVRGFPREGDVVFTTEAPLGNVCRIPHFDSEFYIGQRIITMQTEELNPVYLEYALSDEKFKRKYMEKSSGSTVTGIRVRLLEQLTIPIPPKYLQNEFADFVIQVDKLKFNHTKGRDYEYYFFDRKWI